MDEDVEAAAAASEGARGLPLADETTPSKVAKPRVRNRKKDSGHDGDEAAKRRCVSTACIGKFDGLLLVKRPC